MATKLGAFVLATFLVGTAHVVSSQSADPDPFPTCKVTIPNGMGTDREQPNPRLHGNGQLSVVGLGTIVFKPGGSGFVTRDGALGMKFLWRRGVNGQLKIAGHRIDQSAPSLRFQYSMDTITGAQPSALIVPTPGCWEVTGQVGNRTDSRLTFVVKIVKVGDGPTWRVDAS